MTAKKQILITNDDGVFAPGIRHLCQALELVANVSIVAPAAEKSGAGVGVTLHHPLFVERVEWPGQVQAWKVSGTPVDCVRLGISKLLIRRPDLVVSGINRGSNAGRTALYSGTVGGAIEATLQGIPAIAFSASNFMNPDYTFIEELIPAVVEFVLAHPLPAGTLLNANFPQREEFKGIRFARQGLGYWGDSLEERFHPDGHSYYWLGGEWREHTEHEESDVLLLNQGYATLVPIHVSQLTDHTCFDQHKQSWEQQYTGITSP